MCVWDPFDECTCNKAAEVNPETNDKDTPFQLAFKNNHHDIAKLLLAYGAKPTITSTI